jgi:hypothetical protein
MSSGRRLSARPLVLAAQPPGTVRFETGTGDPDVACADRVAVIAHWDPAPRVSRSARTLTSALEGAGYVTILVSSAEGAGSLSWADGRPPGVTVLRRPNLGYDFGSWTTALDLLPAIRQASHVLLVNDSLVGPFAPIDHLLDRFHRSHADVWGLTDTEQLGHHLQSYCLGFRGGCLERPALRAFWNGIRVESSRDEVIQRYELGLSKVLRGAAMSTEAAIEGWRAVDADDNPTVVGWRRLLDLGFPFVKRQVLRDSGIAPDGHLVHGELRRRYGVQVDEWL